MRKKLCRLFITIFIILLISLIMSSGVQAASKSTEATKRTVYQDDSTASMRVMNIRHDIEVKEYNQKILSNNEESIKLLKEIRDLLQQLNAKE